MDIEKLMKDYHDFFQKQFVIKDIGNYYEITSPFLDNSNDYIQVYASKDKNPIIISDDGYTLSMLELTGLKLSENRVSLIRQVCATLGVKLEDNEMIVSTDQETFGVQLDSLLQAIIKVSDMYYLSNKRVAKVFKDDVLSYFNKHKIYYVENFIATGKSGFTRTYDMLIQRTETKPERLVKIINNTSKATFDSTAFGWIETRETRQEGTKLYVIINDQNKIEKNVLDVFEDLKIETTFWSALNTNSVDNTALDKFKN